MITATFQLLSCEDDSHNQDIQNYLGPCYLDISSILLCNSSFIISSCILQLSGEGQNNTLVSMKGLRDCTSFFDFLYGEFFSTLQIVVNLLQEMNSNILKLNQSVIELKEALTCDDSEQVSKNVPKHVQRYHFKTNVSYTLHVFQ